MLKFLYDLEDGDSVEANLVAEASNRIGTGEFQVFQLGYADWFGRDATPELLENSFFRYLYRNEVPSWARHFSRRVIAMDDLGDLDCNAAHFHRYDPASLGGNSVGTGLAKIIAVFLLFSAFLAVGMVLLHDVIPEGQKCQYPPCTWDEKEPEIPQSR